MKLYQYAIIWHPNDEEKKAGKKSELLIEPKTVLAADDKGALLLAGRAIPESYLTALEQIEVAVRPF